MPAIKTAIGLMSGTSMDGIDAALLETDGETRAALRAVYALPYSEAFRQKLRQGLLQAKALQSPAERPGNLCALEKELTTLHAETVQTLLAREKLRPGSVDIIGFHGQTVLHKPPLRAGSAGFTVQLGNGAALARQTGIAVMADMRAADMRAGGNGAPLVPVYHYALAAQLKGKCAFPPVFVNIGGIANCTYIGGEDLPAAEALAAFDCGPGNCLIDDWAAAKGAAAGAKALAFDEGGKAGLAGAVSEEALKAYRALPIFRQPRRSYDRGDFPPLQNLPAGQGLSYADGAASLAYFTAEQIFRSFQALPQAPKTIIVSGGGAHNLAIMRALRALGSAAGARVITAASLKLNSDFMEAEAWGFLAVRALKKLPLTYPATTGCRQAVSGGVFYPAGGG